MLTTGPHPAMYPCRSAQALQGCNQGPKWAEAKENAIGEVDGKADGAMLALVSSNQV